MSQRRPTSTWCWRAQLGIACERVRNNIKASMAKERGHCDHEKSKKQRKKEHEKEKGGRATVAKERGHCDQGKSKEKKKTVEKGKCGRAAGAKERGHCGRTKGWLAVLLLLLSMSPSVSLSVSLDFDRRSVGDNTSHFDISPLWAPNSSAAVGAMATFWLAGGPRTCPSKNFLELMGHLSHSLFHYVATGVFATQKT